MQRRDGNEELRRKFTLKVLNRDPEQPLKKGEWIVLKMAIENAAELGIVKDEETGGWYVKE